MQITKVKGTVKLRISEALGELGWTQRKLGEAAGISEQGVSNLANNPRAVHLSTLAAIVGATGIPLEQLIVFEPAPEG